ncbi:hypothetical protein LINPERPRIM_LOCUS19284 [Linum perenne]
MKGGVDPKSILKTIENGEDIIDCVDIYKQPAFNHPLLKNHTLQLKPSSYRFGLEDHNSSEVVHTHQFWERNGQNCPQGTVPILRKSMTDLLPKKTPPPRTSSSSSTNSEVHTEYAVGILEGTSMHGATGNINVWQPQVYPNEIVVAQFWVTDNGGPGTAEAIEAGYMVTPSDPEPRIFIYWTADGYKSTGCYNLDCPGFVQTSAKGTVLGAIIHPISKYGDSQQEIISVKFRRDLNNGNWWLIYQGEEIGYWPAELFKNLNTTAKLIEWGGCVVNTKVGKFEIASEMGSGHYPTEGFGKAAFFSNLGFVIEDGEFMDADGLVLQKSKPGCYNIDLNDKTENWGVNFYYGGPGSNSPACIY